MAIAFVQQGGATDDVTFSPDVTLTGVTAGNCLVAVLEATSTAATWSVADDKSNTWVQGVSNLNAFNHIDIWYAVGVASGTTVITPTSADVDTGSAMFVAEFSGVTTSSPVFGSNTADNALGTAHASGSITLTEECVVIAGTTNYNTNPSLDGGSGFTALTDQLSQAYWRAAYKVASSGAQHATWTTVGSTTSVGASLALKAAATASGAQYFSLLGIA